MKKQKQKQIFIKENFAVHIMWADYKNLYCSETWLDEYKCLNFSSI